MRRRLRSLSDPWSTGPGNMRDCTLTGSSINPSFVFGSRPTVNVAAVVKVNIEPARTPNGSCSSVALSSLEPQSDSITLNDIPSKSPKATLCAHISTPPVILKLPRTPSLPSIAVLSGADHSFPSRSPFAAITVQ